MLNQSRYIKIIPFSGLFNWDAKCYLIDNYLKILNETLLRPFSYFAKAAKIEKVRIADNEEYKILGVRSYGYGAYQNRISRGKDLKMKVYQQAKVNHLFWCKVDTKNGAFGIITEELAVGLGSSNMAFAELDLTKINVNYLQLLFKSKILHSYMDNMVTGTTNRKYIKFSDLLSNVKIPLPSLAEQNALVADYNDRIATADSQDVESAALEHSIEEFLFSKLGIGVELNKEEEKENSPLLSFIPYSTVKEWGIDKIISTNNYNSCNYQVANLERNSIYINEVFRGKSPKYSANSNRVVLNQKCIRWNAIETEWAKTVNINWIKSIANKFFTLEGDILINSTGEGTIGRSSYVSKQYEGFLYDSHVLLLRLNPQYINPRYFTYVFNSKYGQSQVHGVKSAQSTKQTELGINNLLKIVLPIPSLDKQNEIVAHIKGLKEQIKQLRTAATTNRTTAQADFEKKIFGELWHKK